MPAPALPSSPTRIKLENTDRGCVHWFNFSSLSVASANTMDLIHPCIIIGKFRPKQDRVIISPITDISNRLTENGVLKYPYHAALPLADNNFLDKDSVVLLDQVFTVPKTDLCEEWYMGKVSNTQMIDEAIFYNFDLFESISNAFKELLSQYKGDYMKDFTRK
ncbi:type II toxin-antitoxin system PemK/MazF family toxin [Paenibacillus sp. FSL M7-0420]|uniref:type II toxin-antitoxin system PemK/MazF family toxin n=1 Tax=Paenibacillus sp. FSL M7-0420 TaxID=2921609 RepID=UPI0030F56227